MKVGKWAVCLYAALFPDSFSWMNYSGAIALWSAEHDQIGESAREEVGQKYAGGEWVKGKFGLFRNRLSASTQFIMVSRRLQPSWLKDLRKWKPIKYTTEFEWLAVFPCSLKWPKIKINGLIMTICTSNSHRERGGMKSCSMQHCGRGRGGRSPQSMHCSVMRGEDH